MGWTTHLDAVRLDQRTWYYLWREDDDLSADHPLLSTPSGQRLHATEGDAREVARQFGEPISFKARYTTDLDTALVWSDAPSMSNLDPGVLVSGWYLLVDLGVLESPVKEDWGAPSELEEIFGKLNQHSVQSEQPYASLAPVEWTQAELALLAATLREGIKRLRARLAMHHSHATEPPAG
jgi:hypothetical protein